MRTALGMLLLAVLSAAPARGDDDVLPQRVLYVGNADSPRAGEFARFLRGRFAEVRVADRETFDPAQADHADVVLLDWSQRDSRSRDARSPLGERASWSKPTVLLGSAGHLLAVPWEIIGGAG